MTGRHRTIAIAMVGLVVMACLLTGCGGDDQGAATGSRSAGETVTGSTSAPLTGLDVSDERRRRPAVVVKVDNSPAAIGRQRGLSATDLVYVEAVEGGITRLAAVFHSDDADEVGPVRSARTTDIDLLASLGRPLLAYSGANAGVLSAIDRTDLIGVAYDTRPDVFSEAGSGVLRLFVDTTDLRALDAAEDGAPPQIHFPYGVSADRGPESGGARFTYPGNQPTEASWEPGEGGWARSQGDLPHTDADGRRIRATNVVVQFTDYRDSGFVDVTGAPSPEASTVGEGEAWVLTDGRLIEGRWVRPTSGSPPRYTDAAGADIEFQPGNTWVELVPPGMATAL